jgi:hypothetical protein
MPEDYYSDFKSQAGSETPTLDKGSPKGAVDYYSDFKSQAAAPTAPPKEANMNPFPRAGKIGMDIIKGIGYGGAQLADLMTSVAMPSEFRGQNRGIPGTALRMVQPQAAQMYQQNFPPQIVNPHSMIPQPYQIGSTAPAAMLAPGLGAGLMRSAVSGGMMNAIQEGAEQGSSGQFDPMKLAQQTAAGTVMGPVVHGITSGIMGLPGLVKSLAQKPVQNVEQEAEQVAQHAITPSDITSETPLATGNVPKLTRANMTPARLKGHSEVVHGEVMPTEPMLPAVTDAPPPLQISKLRRSVLDEKRKNILQRKWDKMLAAKLKEDYYDNAHFHTMKKLRDEHGYDSLKPNLNQPISRENMQYMREEAAHELEISNKKIVRIPKKGSTVETTRETPLEPYKPKGKSETELLKEASALRLKGRLWAKQYADEKTRAQVHKDLKIGHAESLNHEGHKFTVRRYSRGNWTIQASPEEKQLFNDLLKEKTLQEKVELAELRESLVPAWSQLVKEVTDSDPQLAKELSVSRISPGSIDHFLYRQLKQKGNSRSYRDFIKGLIDDDLVIQRIAGAGTAAAGQAIAGPGAGAATTDEQVKQNQLQVGVGLGLMAVGTAMALKPNSLAAQFVVQMGDKMAYPFVVAYANAMKAVKGKLSPETQRSFQGWVNRVLTTAANGDIINNQADPLFAAQFQKLVTRWSEIVSGEGMVLDASETLATKQAYARGFFISKWEDLSKLPLSPLRKQRFWELRQLKKEGTQLLESEIQRLDPVHKGKGGVWGDAGLARILKSESLLNWSSKSPYNATNLDNILNCIAFNVVNAIQLFDISLHAIHIGASGAQIGGRYPTEYARAVQALAARESSAVNFANTIGIKMPIQGNIEDVKNPLSDWFAAKFDDMMNKGTGGLYGKIGSKKAPTVVRETLSGAGAERVFKTNVAVVAASEKAANDLNYSSAESLRKDLKLFLKGDTSGYSSQFTPEKGHAAMSILTTLLSDTIGAGPAGYRIGLVIDRQLPQPWVRSILGSLARNPILFNRSLNSLSEGVLNAAEKGDIATSRRLTRAFYLTLGISSTVAGAGVLNKNIHDGIQHSDPITAQKIHDNMKNLNVFGHVPGALGHPELNFELGHLSSSFLWELNAAPPVLSGVYQSGTKAISLKQTAWQRTMALANLSAAFGWSNLFECASLQNVLRPFRAYQEAAQRGGILEYNFTSPGPYGLFEGLKGKTIIPGVEETKKLSMSRIKMPAIEAALSKFLPGQLEAAQDEQENALNEYIAEGIFQQRYPEAHEAVREQLNRSMLTLKAIRKQVADTGIQEHTPEEWDSLEEEENTPLDIAGHTVTPKTVWKTLLDFDNHNRESFQDLMPSMKKQKEKHIGAYKR